MKQSDLMWGLFAATGNVEAYLIYLDCCKEEKNVKDFENGGDT